MRATTMIARPLFELGAVHATPGALVEIRACEQSDTAAGFAILALLQRHAALEPGVLDAEDQQANRDAIASGARILSSFALRTGGRVWLITEADRSITTILLPEEY